LKLGGENWLGIFKLLKIEQVPFSKKGLPCPTGCKPTVEKLVGKTGGENCGQFFPSEKCKAAFCRLKMVG